jgi:signal transduction histidine kinase
VLLLVGWLPVAGLLIAVAIVLALGVVLFVKERRRDQTINAEVERLSAEHVRLADQIVTAEQEERRRLALFLHDGPVQSLSGIALMLDAAIGSVDDEDAAKIIRSALEKQRDTIRSLRDLSFELEPVVLRDQGFAPAVRALAEQLGIAAQIEIELDVEGAETLAQRAQVTIYQIIREALHQAIRRGPPERITVRVGEAQDGVETVIADDAPGERRRRTFEAIEERARALGGRLEVDQGPGGGTIIRVVFPTYAVRR